MRHAPDCPGVASPNTLLALERLHQFGRLTDVDFDVLADAAQLYDALSQVIRLCIDGPFVPANAPIGLKHLLCRAADEPDFGRLESRLAATQARVLGLYDKIVVAPATENARPAR